MTPSTAASGAATTRLPLRCLTIDVEEYFHIEAAHDRIAPSTWNDWPSRVERNIDLLLDQFSRHGVRGTYFMLGDVAKRQPHLSKRIAAAGHEVASHGTNHERLHRLDARRFRQDVLDCKRLIEDQTGNAVVGYRAPTFSVVPQTAWAIDVLIAVGFEYDASIFPVRHPWYGVRAAPLMPFRVQSGPDGQTLLEVPPLVWRVFSKPVPVAGGGYFRLLPLTFMRRGLAQAALQSRPAVLYFHPWEFDPGMPRMPLPLLGRLRTYRGLRRAASRLDKIMKLPGQWSPIATALDALRRVANALPVFDLSAHA